MLKRRPSRAAYYIKVYKMPTNSNNGYETSNLNDIQSLKIIILGEIWKYCSEQQVLDNYELVYNIFDQTFRKGDLYIFERVLSGILEYLNNSGLDVSF